MTLPFLKWAGSKRQLLPDLRKYVPSDYSVYFETFLGGGALFFDIAPRRAVLADANWELIETYRAVRDYVEELIKLLSKYPRDRDVYYKIRDESTNDRSSIEIGARFIYINRCGFNGLWRENKKGQCNVPFGDMKAPVCDAERLRACSKILKNAEIFHLDFSVAMRAKDGDFCYFDPPYVPLNATSNFVAYTSKGFSSENQVRLRDLALRLRSRGVHVLLSNSNAPVVRSLYQDFEIKEVMARRGINSKADGRGKIKELLIR